MAALVDDFTTRLMDDMDPQLLDFIKNKVNSFIKWDLLRFFHQNPNTTDTADNIAKYAGRNVSDVAPELEKLVTDGLMQRISVGDIVIYTLTENDEQRTLMKKFVHACKDRHFRVKAVYHILRGMR